MFQILSCNPLNQFQEDDVYQYLSFDYKPDYTSDKGFGLFDIDAEYFVIDYDDLSFERIDARELRRWLIRYPDLHKEFMFSFGYFGYIFSLSLFNYLVYTVYLGEGTSKIVSHSFECPRFRAWINGSGFFLFELSEDGLGFGVACTSKSFCINSEYMSFPVVLDAPIVLYFCNGIQSNTGEYLLNFLLVLPSVDEESEYNLCIILDLGSKTYRLRSDFGVLTGDLHLIKDVNAILKKNLFLFG